MPPERKEPTWITLIAWAVGIITVVGLLAQVRNAPTQEINWRMRARNDVAGLTTALRAFRLEYGSFLPGETRQTKGAETQGRLMNALRGLDVQANPKNIVFLEAGMASKGSAWGETKKPRAGIHPDSGAYLDPWGEPYRLRFAKDDPEAVESPYLDDRAEAIRSPVIVWSLGKDGVQGSPGKENILQDSDDVVSWR